MQSLSVQAWKFTLYTAVTKNDTSAGASTYNVRVLYECRL